MKDLLSQISGMISHHLKHTPILVGAKVVVEDPRFSDYNPNFKILPTLKEFCLYRQRILGVMPPPLISHAVIEFTNLDGATVQLLVPISSLRLATTVDRSLGFTPRTLSRLNTLLLRVKNRALSSIYVDTDFHLMQTVNVPKTDNSVSLTGTNVITEPTLDTGNDENFDSPVIVKLERHGVLYSQILVPETSDIQSVDEVKPFVPSTPEQNIAKALASIATLDKQEGLDDLEGTSGRVQVDDKRMINCRADLNQLVPFRYEFAWQAYLKATAHHWMHTEVVMTKDTKDWEQATPEETKSIMSALYSLELLSTFKSEDPCLALYKYITNPEARQYILRQRFEVTVLGNFVHTLMDELSYQFPITEQTDPKTGKVIQQCDWYSITDKNYSSFFKQEQVHARQEIRRNIESFVGDISFNPTTSLEDRQGIVERILYHYLSFGFVFTFSAFIQPLAISRLESDRFNGLNIGFSLMLRDTALQTSFGMLVLKQIFEENPDILTFGFLAKLTNSIRKHVEAELDYMDWWANASLKNAKSDHQIQTLKYMVNRMTKDIGLGKVFDDVEDVPTIEWYVSMYDEFIPDLHSGGATVLGSSGTGSGGTLAGWE